MSGGFLARGVFVQEVFVQGVFVWGFMSGGFCLGVFCPDTVFISHSLHWRYIKTALQEYVIKKFILRSLG